MERFRRQLDPSMQISEKYNVSETLMQVPGNGKEKQDTSLSWLLGSQFGRITPHRQKKAIQGHKFTIKGDHEGGHLTKMFFV